MATPITGGTTLDSGAAARATVAASQTTARPAATVQQPIKLEPAGDTVKLSDRAQVRLLRTQGQSISQISAITDLSTQAVDGYLGLTSAPTPTAAANTK